ncbi:Hydrogen maturation factor [Candidatus Hydrogenisulfobacillus filiaventi]|uniref:Hydrogen maturation factor n=1 Tax=Candidatus Hydrogenisulfobacillus filiaventi TaxID=2707344 RepID=A0A6F8ZJZ3_9FIRM|nr:hydrogenase nickel incorporation protein HypB [Bacillota bacterium]CAB1129773.1 Hydrogen maturation factor [Candidatus Hydrogenisulfobacillus filiaventi]
MCATCGCGHPEEAPHRHAEGERVRLEVDVLAHNQAHAGANRRFFREQGITAFELLSAPGSGKTTLLERTVGRLASLGVPPAVLVGDQRTERDAERLRQAGAVARQIVTGSVCHLDAHMVAHALEGLDPLPRVLFIENVGNLICPALFDLGGNARVVLYSVTEGEDKPYKYADMFQAADLVLITKTDLLPYLELDLPRLIAAVTAVNPAARILPVSARSGAGMEAWLTWLWRRMEAGAAAGAAAEPALGS